ncbi:MAG: hypothetical protein ACI4JA_10755, partial [Oscillospiraceae bacterium]
TAAQSSLFYKITLLMKTPQDRRSKYDEPAQQAIGAKHRTIRQEPNWLLLLLARVTQRYFRQPKTVYQKYLMRSARLKRLAEQPKMWAHFFKNPHYIF